jgi:FMN phosphatase YigB (HAD superfamily)
LRELDAALAAAGLTRDLFDPRLTFLSFEHGFSKPDPNVFRLLTARLRGQGLAPGEALMVGDRADNDLAPARAHGWQAFAIGPDPAACWSRLRDELRPDRSPSTLPPSSLATVGDLKV